MWTGFVSLIKRLDLLSFFCEELCRWCGVSLAQTGLEQPAFTLCVDCSRELFAANKMVWWLPMTPNSRMAPFAASHYDPDILRYPNDRAEYHDGCCDDQYLREKVELLPIATAGRYEGPLQKLIRRLKYDEDVLVTKDLSPLICEAFDMLVTVNDELRTASCVVAVPVPLHPLRRKQRGYNQAEIIAQQLATARNLLLAPNALRRSRETRPQYGLTKLQRSVNVSGAFRASGVVVQDKAVVLVDDVFTSGATLRECAIALKLAGASSVSAVAAAMAPLKSKI